MITRSVPFLSLLIGIAALTVAYATPVPAQDGTASSAPPESIAASPQAQASDAPRGTPAPATERRVEKNVETISLRQQELDVIGRQLLILFVVVAVLESAFSALFQWRAYQILFNARALKTPIMFASGLIMVYTLGYDPFLRLLVAANVLEARTLDPTAFTAIMSALIVSGGVAGVNGLFRTLGIRNGQVSPDAPHPPPDKAWISVLVKTTRTLTEPVQIFVQEAPELPPSAAVVGMIDPRKPGERLRGLFTANDRRFPSYGGWIVKTNTYYRISIRHETTTQTVFEGRFGEGAIVDLTANI